MAKVLLVYPYYSTGILKDQLFPPLGISLLSAVLKQKGVDAVKLDCTFLSPDEAIRQGLASQPVIVGIYVMSTLARNAANLLRRLRDQLPGSLFIAGGPLPTLYPGRFAETYDYVFMGEAASSFPGFCADYLACTDKETFVREFEPKKYPGLYSIGPVKADTPAEHLSHAEMDALPLPDRAGYDHARYQENSLKYCGCKKASIMMTYGCPFNCAFCSKPIFGSQVRYRNLDRVFAEIHDIRSYGYDSLWIADDLFTYNAKYLKNFCGRMLDGHVPVSWSCLSRADCVSTETAALMKKAGCHKVYLGIESGNDDILRLMGKNTNIAAIRKGVQAFASQGIDCAGFFLVGYPGESEATIEETFQFALSLPLQEISFNVPYPLPGSRLFQIVAGVSEDDWNYENETRFLYESAFDADWLSQRIHETTDEFNNRREGSAGISQPAAAPSIRP